MRLHSNGQQGEILNSFRNGNREDDGADALSAMTLDVTTGMEIYIRFIYC